MNLIGATIDRIIEQKDILKINSQEYMGKRKCLILKEETSVIQEWFTFFELMLKT